MPLLGPFAEQEWFHKLMVILVVPVTGLAVCNLVDKHLRHLIFVILIIGLTFLVTAAFAPAAHDYEVSMTVIGALLLAFGHILRWRAHGR